MSLPALWLAFVMIVNGTMIVLGIGDPIHHGWVLVMGGSGIFAAAAVLRLWEAWTDRRIRR